MIVNLDSEPWVFCMGYRKLRSLRSGCDLGRGRQSDPAKARRHGPYTAPQALNILRAKDIQNVSQALYVNALNFDQLLALGSS